MNKSTMITLKEIFDLKEELSAVLTNKVSIGTRYALHKLKTNVDDLIKAALETKDELIRQYGEADDNSVPQLKVYQDEETKTINPQFELFLTEWNKVLAEEKEIAYTPIEIDSIKAIETEKEIEQLFNLVA